MVTEVSRRVEGKKGAADEVDFKDFDLKSMPESGLNQD